MSSSFLYKRYFEYSRVTSTVSVTDEGTFLKDEVPEDYGGAQMDIKVVHAVSMVNSSSEILILEFYVEPPMDKDRKKGGPITRDGDPVFPASGDSSVEWVTATEVNPTLTPSQKSSGEFAVGVFKVDRARVPSSPQY
jgi:hypothetical protein